MSIAALLTNVRFNPTLGGTTDWTPSTAVTGYQMPTAGGVKTSVVYHQFAISADSSQWEFAEGIYDGTKFLRTTVLWNSSATGTKAGQSGAGTKINFTTVPSVAIVGIDEDLTPSLRNYITNPSGEINQRGLGTIGNNTYDFDRWLTLVQTASVTISQQTLVEDTTPFMMRSLQAQAAAQRFGRIQWIPGNRCRNLRSQNVCLSARVRMSASTTLRYAIVEWTGTIDVLGAGRDIVNNWTSATFTTGNFFKATTTAITATGSIALTANTLTDITPLFGTVSASMNNMAIFFWTDSTQAQNVTLDIAKVKLEAALSPTRFEHPDWVDEYDKCQAYFWKTFSYVTTPAQNTGFTDALQFDSLVAGIQNFSFTFGRKMFKAGTMVSYNPAATNSSVRDSTNSADRVVGALNVSEWGGALEFNSVAPACRNFIHLTHDADL